MKAEQVEIYSDASNIAVLRHPGRAFPGSLIQGDSLYSLLLLAKEADNELSKKNHDEAHEVLIEVIELLQGRLNHYEAIMKEHGLELPYVK